MYDDFLKLHEPMRVELERFFSDYPNLAPYLILAIKENLFNVTSNLYDQLRYFFVRYCPHALECEGQPQTLQPDPIKGREKTWQFLEKFGLAIYYDSYKMSPRVCNSRELWCRIIPQICRYAVCDKLPPEWLRKWLIAYGINDYDGHRFSGLNSNGMSNFFILADESLRLAILESFKIGDHEDFQHQLVSEMRLVYLWERKAKPDYTSERYSRSCWTDIVADANRWKLARTALEQSEENVVAKIPTATFDDYTAFALLSLSELNEQSDNHVDGIDVLWPSVKSGGTVLYRVFFKRNGYTKLIQLEQHEKGYWFVKNVHDLFDVLSLEQTTSELARKIALQLTIADGVDLSKITGEHIDCHHIFDAYEGYIDNSKRRRPK